MRIHIVPDEFRPVIINEIMEGHSVLLVKQGEPAAVMIKWEVYQAMQNFIGSVIEANVRD